MNGFSPNQLLHQVLVFLTSYYIFTKGCNFLFDEEIALKI